ncbi:hypothetical protein AB4Z18_18175 [Leifsonia sp. 2TAF2]|uniref:hypothetical protein n=1 Tax=Leifsonia sp. 2TAF2 TaxID=3233009 RepID=UPI003F9B59CB
MTAIKRNQWRGRAGSRALTVAGVAASAAIAIALVGAAPAEAEADSISTLAAVTKATAGTVDAAAPVDTTASGMNAIHAPVGGAEVTVPTRATGGISVETAGGDFAVSLPFASGAAAATVEKKGIVSYNNNNGSISVPVVVVGGSLQINTVIAKRSAPSHYSYRLTIPTGGQIVQVGKSYFLLNASQDPIAYISEPWATDAKGAAVSTHYTLKGSTLTQVVEASAATAYPVVADPAFVWETGLPSLKWNKKESADLRTQSKSPAFCAAAVGKLPPPVNWAITGLCLANLLSITVNAQRIVGKGECVQWLIGPGVIGSIGYKGGNCK